MLENCDLFFKDAPDGANATLSLVALTQPSGGAGPLTGQTPTSTLTLLDGTLLPPQFLKRGRRGPATEPPKASAAPVADTLATAPRTAAREKLLPRRSRGYA